MVGVTALAKCVDGIMFGEEKCVRNLAFGTKSEQIPLQVPCGFVPRGTKVSDLNNFARTLQLIPTCYDLIIA